MIILLSILALGILIILHEFGHFIFAKLCKVKVEEFSVGMGPLLLSRKKSETLYSLRLLPIGGYCKMLGEDEDIKDEAAFNSKSVFQRFLILFAGSFMNFILAVVIFIIMGFMLVKPIPIIQSVLHNYPAEKAGLKSGDVITYVNNNKINSWDNLQKQISDNRNKQIVVTVNRDGKILNFDLKPIYDKQNKATMIGVSPKGKIAFNGKANLINSVVNGIKQTFYLTYVMLVSLAGLFVGKISINDFMGPVGIVNVVGEAARSGLYNLLGLTALISLNLSVMNLLPIPALDGSRIMFLAIEKIRHKPVDREKEGLVHFVGFVFLMLFMLFMTYKDIIRLKR